MLLYYYHVITALLPFYSLKNIFFGKFHILYELIVVVHFASLILALIKKIMYLFWVKKDLNALSVPA